MGKWVESWWAVNVILGSLSVRPWSWVLDLTFSVEIVEELGDFHWDRAEYPDHVWRPVPWFEIPLSCPSFDKPDGKALWIKLYEDFRRKLESHLSKERLLIFDVRSGWAPLLTFLGIEDPELAASPFPNVNDRSSLQTVRRVLDILGAGLPAWVSLLCVMVFLIFRCTCRRLCRCAQKAKEKTS